MSTWGDQQGANIGAVCLFLAVHTMHHHLVDFLLHWGITALSLWIASRVFQGIRISSTSDLIVAALLLGFANAIVKPILVLLTLPLTLLTFGLFLLVINALMLMLVSSLVKGFKVSGFWTALFASIFIALLSMFFGAVVLSDHGAQDIIRMPRSGRWV